MMTMTTMNEKAKTPLFSFQRDSVERAKNFNGRCLLALEQGLGKTLVAITYIMETNAFPAIIVCPASLKYNWSREFEKHYGKKVTVLSGTKAHINKLSTDPNPVYIINYDIIHAWVDLLLAINPKILVLDESQMIKTPSARRTRACGRLAMATDNFLALSGTPMSNSPMDIYTTLNMILKGKMINRWQFMNRYTKYYQGRFGLKITGARNERELNEYLNHRCMIRYRVDDVLPDLPPFIRQTLLIEMSREQAAEYEKLKDGFITWLHEKFPNRRITRASTNDILTQFGYMKRQVAEWKIPTVIDNIHTFLDNNEGKLLVFGLHKKVLDGIWSAFSKHNKPGSPLIVRIDGSTPTDDRMKAVDAIQTGTARVFLGQMIAAGVGLTLTASHHSLFSELDFLPMNHLQAEARNRRIGTEASFVHYNYLVMKDTIEEIIASTLFRRQKAVDQIIDGREDSDSFDLIGKIIQEHFIFSFG